MADPKRGARIIDPTVTTRACLTWRECAVCGGPSATGHHVIPRGAPHLGDDVLANIVPLCGSGTTGCHGAVEAGDRNARRALGVWIAERRPDTLAYVLGKLGEQAGDDYMRRRY